MKALKIEQKENGSIKWAGSRDELKEAIGLCEQSLSRIMTRMKKSRIVSTQKFIIREVEIDESSIKEKKENNQ